MTTTTLQRITGIMALTGVLVVTGSLGTIFAYFSATPVSGCTNVGYGYGYEVTCPVSSGGGTSGGGSVSSNGTVYNPTTTNLNAFTMSDVRYGVAASNLEKTNPGYFTARNAYLAKTFAAKGIKKMSAIRRELAKSSEFTTSSTSRKDQAKLVSTLYRLIKAVK